jgi:hypothetical protein
MGIPSLKYFYDDNLWINVGLLRDAVEGGPLHLLMTLIFLRVYNEQENYAILILGLIDSYHETSSPWKFPKNQFLTYAVDWKKRCCFG